MGMLVYKTVRGKLSNQDSREAYVTRPVKGADGAFRDAPIASFWSFREAEQYANQKNAELNLWLLFFDWLRDAGPLRGRAM